jgi:hypothetical protein
MSDPPVLETQVPEQIYVTIEDGDWEKLDVYNPENEQVSVEEEEARVAVVLDEIPDDSQKVAGLASQIEEVSKKSYASIVSLCSKIPSSFLTLLRHSLLYHSKCHLLYS